MLFMHCTVFVSKTKVALSEMLELFKNIADEL